MKLPYDPAAPEFLQALTRIPGYPPGDRVPIHAMLFESDALFRLPELFSEIGGNKDAPLWVVVDELPIRRNGVELKPLAVNHLRAAGWDARTLVLTPSPGEGLHTDLHQIETVKTQLTPRAAVLAIGSGTVTDVAKHACFLYEQENGAHLPFIVLPTANSVSAYTSNTASVEVGGVKKTLPSRYLDVLVCDLETLGSAPLTASVAGIGDILVAFGSFADWFLAAKVGLDHNYSDLPRTLIGPLDEIFIEYAEDIRTCAPRGVQMLAKLLALEGIATSLAHTTAPFSGFEHLISHLLDLLTKHYQLAPILHGTQVALLTVLTTLAYREVIEHFDPQRLNLDACFPSAAEMETRVRRAFAELDPSGGIANECWNEYRKKLEAWHSQRATVENVMRNWGTLRAELETIARPPQDLVEILQRMGSPTLFEQLNPPMAEAHIKFAFMSASFIRNRFTLGDLLLFTNWDLESLWDSIWRSSRALVRAANAAPV